MRSAAIPTTDPVILRSEQVVGVRPSISTVAHRALNKCTRSWRSPAFFSRSRAVSAMACSRRRRCATRQALATRESYRDRGSYYYTLGKNDSISISALRGTSRGLSSHFSLRPYSVLLRVSQTYSHIHSVDIFLPLCVDLMYSTRYTRPYVLYGFIRVRRATLQKYLCRTTAQGDGKFEKIANKRP